MLCLDPGSLQVSVRGVPTPERTADFLRARLEERLTDTVERFRLPLERGEVCGADARLRITLEVRGVSPGVLDYGLVVAVAGSDETTGGAPRFDLRFGSRFDEAFAAEPYLVTLPRYGGAMTTDLALAWWEDNTAVPPPKRRWLPPLLGAGLAGLVLLAGRRVRRQRSGRHGRAGGKPYDGA